MIVTKCPSYTRSGGCVSVRTREMECIKCNTCELKQAVRIEATEIQKKILGVIDEPDF